MPVHSITHVLLDLITYSFITVMYNFRYDCNAQWNSCDHDLVVYYSRNLHMDFPIH